MKEYTKEEHEFIDREFEKLSKNYPELNIFNRNRNPYLLYKDSFETTKEYKEIQDKKEWWQNHIVKLLENRKELILFKDRDSKENRDILLFILISLYFEVPIAYEFHHMYNKLKELDKEYLAKRNKTMNTLKNLRQEIIDNIYPYLNLKTSTKNRQKELEMMCRIQFNRMYSIINETYEFLSFLNNDEIEDFHYVNTMNYSYQYNEVWTRKLRDKTGLRQIVLRQIAVLLDLIYHGKYTAFNKPSYLLLDYIMPCDEQNESMMYGFTQEEVYKVIKGISYYDDYKNYSHVFEGYKRYYQNNGKSKIDSYIQEWKGNNLSYSILDKIILELIDIDKWSDNPNI
ncbi:MAG: hypothetical protein ACRC0X_04310 [Brevinema sp.]